MLYSKTQPALYVMDEVSILKMHLKKHSMNGCKTKTNEVERLP